MLKMNTAVDWAYPHEQRLQSDDTIVEESAVVVKIRQEEKVLSM